MTIQIGTTQINEKYLGPAKLNKIMLGAIEIFPNTEDVPVITPITILNTQADAVTGASTNTIPLNTAGIQAGDTIVVLRRTNIGAPPTISLNGSPFTRCAQRTNGGSTVFITIDILVAPAGLGDTGINNIIASAAGILFASIFVVRGGNAAGLTVVNGTADGANQSTLAVPPTSNSQQNLFVGMGGSPGTASASITSFTASVPVAANIGTPRNGMTGLACIVGVPATVTIGQAPIGTGQLIMGCWLTYTP